MSEGITQDRKPQWIKYRGLFLLLFVHQFRKLVRNGGYFLRRDIDFARIIGFKRFPSFLKGLLKLLFLFLGETVAKLLETFIGPVDKLVKLVSLQNLLAFFLVLIGHLLASLFLNKEVPPVEGTDVISASVLVAVEICKKVVEGLERKRPPAPVNSCLVIVIVFS